MTQKFPLSPIDDVYRKAIVAGAVFLVCMEVMYFWLSGVPSFAIPSKDALGETAIGRDFLNIWFGAKSAFNGGPAIFFDFWNYNLYLQDYFATTDLHHYFWSYPPHILLFIWPFGLMPYLAAFVVWSVLGFTAFMVAASAGGVERKHLMFVAVAPAVAVNLFIGQNGFFFAALLICGLVNMDRRPLLAGLCFGINDHQAAAWIAFAGDAGADATLARHRGRRRDDDRAGRRDLRDLRRRDLVGVSRQGRADAALPAGERRRPAPVADPVRVL